MQLTTIIFFLVLIDFVSFRTEKAQNSIILRIIANFKCFYFYKIVINNILYIIKQQKTAIFGGLIIVIIGRGDAKLKSSQKCFLDTIFTLKIAIKIVFLSTFKTFFKFCDKTRYKKYSTLRMLYPFNLTFNEQQILHSLFVEFVCFFLIPYNKNIMYLFLFLMHIIYRELVHVQISQGCKNSIQTR